MAALDEQYGTEKICYLNYNEPWQLLVAVILSAQCTDARVNMVTPALFERYKTPQELGEADPKEVEEYIHSAGFYVTKARNIIACCQRLSETYGGEVPSQLDELLTLAGVGRKTANVIRGNIYDEPSIVVDTHVKRISNKLGFSKENDPEKIEYDLMKVLPKDHWILYNIHIITLGRQICVARRPKCGECFLAEYCPSCQCPAQPAAEASGASAVTEAAGAIAVGTGPETAEAITVAEASGTSAAGTGPETAGAIDSAEVSGGGAAC